ncbi:hypothetical protein BVG80_12270 [Sphingobacteriales bacterium TSM_CSM]|nr:hypothetical protein BVG80_12270 [Sphingobacteriales bacterium TSM_CSM]
MLNEWSHDSAEAKELLLSIEVTATHDDDRPVYITGNFNNWVTDDDRFKMVKLEHGKYHFTFPAGMQLPQTIEYKFVKSGAWHNVEIDTYGNTPPNRRIEKTRGYVKDHVYRFQTNGQFYNPRFLPQIQLLTNGDDIPKMRIKRNIWAVLPYNYYQSSEYYPVLYLHDAQNLFNDNAPFGNWAIDRKLAVLAERNMGNLIIIAIDHAGHKRIHDFSLYPMRTKPQEGKKYVNFISNVLKPYVDQNLRTLTHRDNTGIGGSSLGGLVSIYAGLTQPLVFSKLMVFSPSLWMNPHIHFESMHIKKTYQTKVYIYAGGQEGANMVNNVYSFKETLEKQGISEANLRFRLNIDPEGKHNERYWGEEFPKAVEWLYFSN